MQQFGSRRADFCEIFYLGFLLENISKKIQVAQKSEKYDG
jgi:hypothetical protein